MTALAHFMGLACFFKRHRCGDGRAKLAGFNQGRYLDKLIGVRLNRYHEAPNAMTLASIFRRLTNGRNKPAAAVENLVNKADFVRVGTCFVSNVCPTTGCRGEDVTRTTLFADFVPQTPEVPEGDLESRVIRLEQSVTDIQETIEEILDKL